MSYIFLRGRWCIILSNVRKPNEEKSDDSKDSFYENLKQGFDHFPKYHTKILFEDLNAEVGRENNSKPTIGNDSVHQDSSDKSIRIGKFAISKI